MGDPDLRQNMGRAWHGISVGVGGKCERLITMRVCEMAEQASQEVGYEKHLLIPG